MREANEDVGERRSNKAQSAVILPNKAKSPQTSDVCDDDGADDQIRTGDLVLTKDALCLLSYTSNSCASL